MYEGDQEQIESEVIAKHIVSCFELISTSTYLKRVCLPLDFCLIRDCFPHNHASMEENVDILINQDCCFLFLNEIFKVLSL